MKTPPRAPLVWFLAALTSCHPHPTTAPSPRPRPGKPGDVATLGVGGPAGDSIGFGLPPVPIVNGSLAIRVVYPAATDLVDAGDSSFIFGSVGTGEASLSINGTPVPVWPNGAWLAWLPFPPDSLVQFELTARTATDSAHLIYEARRLRHRVNPPAMVWIDSASIVPAGRVWWPRDEYLPVVVRAAEGAEVRIRLPGGRLLPLVTDPRPDDVAPGVRAFDRDTTNLRQPTRSDRYLGVIRGIAVGADPGPILGLPPLAPAADSASGPPARLPTGSPARRPAGPPAGPPARPSADTIPTIEAIVGADTVRVRWNVQLAMLDTLPVVTQLDDDTARTGTTDQLTVGRARPGATYHWFFPTGTRANVSGRIGDDLRLRLSRGADAWIPVADAQPLPAGSPGVRATVGSATLHPGPDRLGFRIPLSQRVPFQVSEEEQRLSLRLYSAVGDVNWIRYGGTDPYVRTIQWTQAAADEVVFTFDLAGPVWGYRTHWDQNDLIFELRRPPPVDSARPFAGRLIEVDPGHPPLGATGPTGLREAEANLAVALELREMLLQAGARVVMTRIADTAVDLWPRVKLADSIDADLLVSIHNNALPDGVEPFRNNGSSVFYNHPRSLPLAYAVERALVRRLGLRDLGVGRGDLALVRPTWMPAILCEGLFMMLPEQEAALRSPEGQRRYARAVFEGMEEFLRGVNSER